MNFHPNAMASHQIPGAGRNYAYIRQPMVGNPAGLSAYPLNLMQAMQPNQAVLSGSPMMLQHPNIAQPGQVLLRQGQPLLLRQPGTNLLQQQAQGYVHNGISEVPVSGILSSRYNFTPQGQSGIKVNALIGPRVNINPQGQAQLINARVNLNSPQQAGNGALVRNLIGNNIQIPRPAFVLQNGQNMFTTTVSNSSLQTHTVVSSSSVSQTEVVQSESNLSPREESASPHPTISTENSGLIPETSISSPPCSGSTTENPSNIPKCSETTIVSIADTSPSNQGSKLVIPTETRVLHREKPYDKIIRPNYIALTDPNNHTSNKKDSKDLLIESLQKELQRLQKENSELKVENQRLKGEEPEPEKQSAATPSDSLLVSITPGEGNTEEEEIDEEALLNTDSHTDDKDTLGASPENPENSIKGQISNKHINSDTLKSVVETNSAVTSSQNLVNSESDPSAEKKDTEASTLVKTK